MIFPPPRQSQNFLRPSGRNFMMPNRGFQNMPSQGNIGGILQRFLGSNQSQNIGQMASKGFGGISKTLNSVQQVLRVVDTAAPIVKQYGPMVRNLPAMYRMMKAFKNMESTNTDSDSENDNDNETKEASSNKESIDIGIESDILDSYESNSSSESNTYRQHEQKTPKRSTTNGESTPKLFI